MQLKNTVMQKNRKTLSFEAFSKTRGYLKNKARPLEFARFESIFCGSDTSSILRELKEFHNEDGGFGHALEPDLRSPDSSALCTTIALQIMREHKVSPEEDMLRSAITYLVETIDETEFHWRIIPKSSENSPHAPWWNQKGRESEYSCFSLNPTAEILGYLIDYSNPEFEDVIYKQIYQTLRKAESIEMHDLLCCLKLVQTESLSTSRRNELLVELKRIIADTISCDPKEWKGYCLRPLQVISEPESPFIDGLEDAVDIDLDDKLATQQSDGAWHPNWSWGDNYPNSWALAKKEWSGFVTLEILKALKNFGRIEGITRRSTQCR